MENKENAKWYVLHTFSGYEKIAKENLKNVIEKFNLQDRIFDIEIPIEKTIEEKNGKEVVTERKVMPCYLIVKMIYGDDIWHNIIRTRGITGFVGPKGRPLALTDDEVRKLNLEEIKSDFDIVIGDKIQILEGPLEKLIGTVVAIDNENKNVDVVIEMFGRSMPVKVDFEHIRKI